MAAYIVAIGLVSVHAFATAVLWLEFRSREKRSMEHIDKATERILEAITHLRGDLVPSGGPGGAPLPAPALVSLDLRQGDEPPDSEPRRIPLEKLAALTAEELALVDARAATHGISREEMLDFLVDLGLFEVERGPGRKAPPGSPANDG